MQLNSIYKNNKTVLPISVIFIAGLINVAILIENNLIDIKYKITIYILQIILLTIVYRTSKIGSWITAITNSILLILYPDVLYMTIVDTCIAILILGFNTKRVIEIWAYLSLINLPHIVNLNNNKTTIIPYLVISLCYLTILAITLLARWQTASVAETMISFSNINREKNRAIASILHDSVTNDLSYITALSTTHTVDENDSWDTIAQKTRDTSQSIHNIANILINESDAIYSKHNELQNVIKQQEDLLTRAGLKGHIKVNNYIDNILLDEKIKRELYYLIIELATNIIKHADCSFEYYINISFSSKYIEITQTNIIKDDNKITEDIFGLGLKNHKHNISILGGILRYSIEEKTWVLYAQIPIQ